jgi:hypothetical protein
MEHLVTLCAAEGLADVQPASLSRLSHLTTLILPYDDWKAGALSALGSLSQLTHLQLMCSGSSFGNDVTILQHILDAPNLKHFGMSVQRNTPIDFVLALPRVSTLQQLSLFGLRKLKKYGREPAFWSQCFASMHALDCLVLESCEDFDTLLLHITHAPVLRRVYIDMHTPILPHALATLPSAAAAMAFLTAAPHVTLTSRWGPRPVAEPPSSMMAAIEKWDIMFDTWRRLAAENAPRIQLVHHA